MGQEVLAIFLAWVCLGVITCYPSDTHFSIHLERSINANTVQFCGTQLATAISIVCKGNYNTMDNVLVHQKRNDHHRAETIYPFKRREDAHSFIRGRVRRRRGVSDECCKKPCSYDELKTFCGPNTPFN